MNVEIVIPEVTDLASVDLNFSLIVEMCYSADYCLSETCVSFIDGDESHLKIDGPMSEEVTFQWEFTMSS